MLGFCNWILVSVEAQGECIPSPFDWWHQASVPRTGGTVAMCAAPRYAPENSFNSNIGPIELLDIEHMGT